ncbi:MAG: 3-hydroxyisobutyrate dehydrogenase [Proteobacteria bacterium]|nr:3-hydroxyisobutyrate dehydrogenase [Pseudomonadota bacterium]
MTKIGFIGLGNMGLHMVRNLLAAGHELKVFDLAEATVAAAAEAGASPAGSVAEAAKGVEVVISMVPAGKHVKAVYLGDQGVIANADAGALLVDCSTIDVATAREVSAAAADAGFEMLDAPVSGGVGGAEAGTLTFMVGGSPEAFARVSPLLEIMGKNIIHAGGPGNGEAAKICNNMMLAISMIGASEIFALGRRLGLEDQTLFDVASTSSARCWSIDTYCPVPGPVPTSPANRDYEGGFAAALMLKDVLLSQEAAQDVGLDTPLGAHAAEIYTKFADKGHANMDFSAIFKMLNGDL